MRSVLFRFGSERTALPQTVTRTVHFFSRMISTACCSWGAMLSSQNVEVASIAFSTCNVSNSGAAPERLGCYYLELFEMLYGQLVQRFRRLFRGPSLSDGGSDKGVEGRFQSDLAIDRSVRAGLG